MDACLMDFALFVDEHQVAVLVAGVVGIALMAAGLTGIMHARREKS